MSSLIIQLGVYADNALDASNLPTVTARGSIPIAAYNTSAFGRTPADFQSAPSQTADATGTTSSGGALTLTGLTSGQSYWLYAVDVDGGHWTLADAGYIGTGVTLDFNYTVSPFAASISRITSNNGSVTVTDPTGPTTDLAVPRGQTIVVLECYVGVTVQNDGIHVTTLVLCGGTVPVYYSQDGHHAAGEIIATIPAFLYTDALDGVFQPGLTSGFGQLLAGDILPPLPANNFTYDILYTLFEESGTNDFMQVHAAGSFSSVTFTPTWDASPVNSSGTTFTFSGAGGPSVHPIHAPTGTNLYSGNCRWRIAYDTGV